MNLSGFVPAFYSGQINYQQNLFYFTTSVSTEMFFFYNISIEQESIWLTSGMMVLYTVLLNRQACGSLHAL